MWFHQIEEDLTAFKLAKLRERQLQKQKCVILMLGLTLWCLFAAILIVLAERINAQ